jgi:hypothetical protein
MSTCLFVHIYKYLIGFTILFHWKILCISVGFGSNSIQCVSDIQSTMCAYDG